MHFRLDGGYTLTNFEARGRALRTNVAANTAMRGFGGPEAQIIIEEIVDRIAHELKMNPKDIKEVAQHIPDFSMHNAPLFPIILSKRGAW